MTSKRIKTVQILTQNLNDKKIIVCTHRSLNYDYTYTYNSIPSRPTSPLQQNINYNSSLSRQDNKLLQLSCQSLPLTSSLAYRYFSTSALLSLQKDNNSDKNNNKETLEDQILKGQAQNQTTKKATVVKRIPENPSEDQKVSVPPSKLLAPWEKSEQNKVALYKRAPKALLHHIKKTPEYGIMIGSKLIQISKGLLYALRHPIETKDNAKKLVSAHIVQPFRLMRVDLKVANRIRKSANAENRPYTELEKRRLQAIGSDLMRFVPFFFFIAIVVGA